MKCCSHPRKHISASGQHWLVGKEKNIEIDLLQENRNADLKGLIHLMGANKTEKAIGRMSKAAGGVRKIVDAFEEQAVIKSKSSAHSHGFSSQDEKKNFKRPAHVEALLSCDWTIPQFICRNCM